MISGSGRSKSRLPKAPGAEPCGQRRNENCTPLWPEAHFPVKMDKAHLSRTHFSKLGCRNMARRCGPKRVFKSTCTKHTILGPLLEVCMWKNGTPLWREAHSKVKMLKTEGLAPLFLLEVRMWKNGMALWREAHLQVKMYKTLAFCISFGGSDIEKVSDRWH